MAALHIIIHAIEGDKWGVNGILMDGNIAVGGTGGLGTTYPSTWEGVIEYATGLIKSAEEQGISLEMRNDHNEMLRATQLKEPDND